MKIFHIYALRVEPERCSDDEIKLSKKEGRKKVQTTTFYPFLHHLFEVVIDVAW